MIVDGKMTSPGMWNFNLLCIIVILFTREFTEFLKTFSVIFYFFYVKCKTAP